jgi:glycosyltransferase involved in cell wall biosynthesis
VLRGFGDAIRVVRQENAGLNAATETGIRESRGELIALLDADDLWPRGKIRRQVEALAERPHVGLLYGDMTVIDAEGSVLQESWLEDATPPEGRPFAALLAGNLATSSSIVIRASLARRLAPIPADVPFADWYLALRAAQESEIGYLAEPRTLYRHHGANMSLGTTGAARERELRKSLVLQRWFLRRLRAGAVAPLEAWAAWTALERFAAEVHAEARTPFAPTVEVCDRDRAKARTLAARASRALGGGDAGGALVRFVCAAATDPWCAPAREGVERALALLT